MISLLCGQSRLCMAAIIFYTCVWIPALQLKRAVFGILGYMIGYREKEIPQLMLYLPAARFGDLRLYADQAEAKQLEVCSICLAEFEGEDVVSQLPKCRHVFHMDCIEKWVDRDQFSCPLCRCLLLAHVYSSHAKCSATSTTQTDHHHHDLHMNSSGF